jgi:hypothetical protein
MSKNRKRSRSKGKSKKFQSKRPKVSAPLEIDEEFAEAEQAKAEAKQRKAEEAEAEKTKAKAEKAKAEEAEVGEAEAEEAKAEERKAEERRVEDRRAEERKAKERRAKERRAKEQRSEDSQSEEGEVADPLPGPPSFWRRNDLSVLLFALVVFVGGTFVTRDLANPKQIDFDNAGLHFERPTGWLPAQQTSSKAAGLAGTASGFGTKDKTPETDEEAVHIVYQSARDSRLRIEVHIGPRPAYRNLRGARAIERLGQYGEFYWEAESGSRSIDRRDWVRSRFRYAFKAGKSGSPQIANAVEYATIQDKRLYVVTLHGESESMQDLDNLISPTLRIGHAAPATNGVEGSRP